MGLLLLAFPRRRLKGYVQLLTRCYSPRITPLGVHSLIWPEGDGFQGLESGYAFLHEFTI